MTMISRLHNFDGSMKEPDKVVYIEFPKNSGGSVHPILSTAQLLDIESARQKMNQFNETGSDTNEASLMGNWFEAPVEPVQALHYYRLIYETAELNADGSPNYNQSVKVFEYVAGARFAGEGIIEVTVQTNLGRTFVYRQESQAGQFILPYPTRNSSYPVTTTGPYRMVNSGKLLEVDEVDVREGNIIFNSN
jgi:dolichyl-diphosphooligosaccharide--protein glycosyltransferase